MNPDVQTFALNYLLGAVVNGLPSRSSDQIDAMDFGMCHKQPQPIITNNNHNNLSLTLIFPLAIGVNECVQTAVIPDKCGEALPANYSFVFSFPLLIY